MKYLFLLLGLLVAMSPQAQPQRRANVWHFGSREGLDFTCGRPQKVKGATIISLEGATGICDENGELLFYTNAGGGLRGGNNYVGGIWNRRHELMYDLGNDRGGGISSAQGGIIIPDPAGADRYYLFTVDELESIGELRRPHRGISFFNIDMKANGGLGAVRQNQNKIFAPAIECITAARHGNGTDYWILSVDYNSRDLLAIQVTAAGVSAPIRHPRQIRTNPLVLKLSPDGRYLFDGTGLYHFNAGTGGIEFITPLTNGDEYSFNFSAGSRYLYMASRQHRAIIRYRLRDGIRDEDFEILKPLESYGLRHMQTGPDGSIYLNTNNLEREIRRVDLSVIQCPDSDTPRILFDQLILNPGLDFGPYSSLSNIADFWFDELLTELEIDTTEVRLCEGKGLGLRPLCEGDAYRWSTGETSRQITVTQAGEYRVSVTNGCFTGVETFVVVPGAPPTVDIAYEPFDDFCDALPLTLTAISTGADTLFWSTDTLGSTLQIERGGRYVATARNSCGEARAVVNFPTADCCRVFVPNAFSPNGDGINDDILPLSHNCPITNFRFQIFSRWGILVFETNDLTQTWNGQSGGVVWPSGVYVWQVSYQLANDPPQRRRFHKGDITLFR